MQLADLPTATSEPTLAALWATAVLRHASRPLLRSDEDGSLLTYGEAGEIVASLRLRLLSAGLRPGDRIAIAAPVHAEALLVCWAAMTIGAVVAPLDHCAPPEALAKLCAKIEPAILFCSQSRADLATLTGLPCILFDGMAPAPPPEKAFSAWLREPAPHRAPSSPPKPGAPAAIIFTSGTSGTSKGVVLSQAALYRSGALMATSYGWRPEDVLLNLGELHTMSGLRNPWLAVLHAGCALVVASTMVRSNGLAVCACIQRHRVSILGCVAAMILQFVRFSDRIGQDTLASLHQVLCTGSRLPDAWAEGFEQSFGVPVWNYYGLTETGGLCAGVIPGLPGRCRGTIGIPLGCQTAILDEAEQEVPIGAMGELFIQSEQLMSGYWQDSEQTRRVLRDGWFHTGDLVRQTSEGCLILVDRREEAFKNSRGEFIHPVEIEEALETHPRVAEAGVCCCANLEAEDAIVAFVVPLHQAQDWPGMEADLRSFVAERLGVHLTPTRILSVASLPRGTNDKLLRRKLKEGYPNHGSFNQAI